MRPVSSLSAPSLTLVVPGLLWPNPALQDTVFDLPLPALQTLLGRSTLSRKLQHEHDWWQQLTGSPLAAAPMRRLALGGTPQEGNWLCADPVHLRFEEQTLILDDPAKVQLTPEERDALAATLAPLLAEFGQFELSATQHWHLKPHETLPPCPPLLTGLIGRPARVLFPEGIDYRPWRRLFNEIQMALHQHPVNQSREAAGQALVNSLAFWGGGALPTTPGTAPGFDRVQSGEAFHHGLARYWQTETTSLPATYAPTPGHTLAYQPSLLTPTRMRDALRWREGLKSLEQDWFAPLLDALNKGRLHSLQLIGFGEDTQQTTCLTAITGHRDKLKFWRRPSPLTVLHP